MGQANQREVAQGKGPQNRGVDKGSTVMSLRISSRALRRFFDQSPIPLVLASPVFEDCPLIMVNDPFLSLVGYARDEVIGRNGRFLQGPQTQPEARASLKAAVAGHRELTVSITNYRRNGEPFTNLIFLFPIFDGGDRFTYMLGSQCDISGTHSASLPGEHARLLDRALRRANPLLAQDDNLRISATTPCTSTIDRHLARDRLKTTT